MLIKQKHSNINGAAACVAALLFLVASSSAQSQDTEVVYQLQTLLEEVRALRGQVEAQQVELENLRRRQRDQYLDLDERLQALGRQGVAASGQADALVDALADSTSNAMGEGLRGAPIGAVPEVREQINTTPEIITLAPPSDAQQRVLDQPTDREQVAYDQAFSALKDTRYADAAAQFSAFVDQYPNSSFAPNAYYWLAETYYVTRDFETALAMFQIVLERFPDSGKAGDALLKLGFSHFELQQWPAARAALEQVRSDYPDTTLSRLAESRLRDMRLSGRL